MLEIRILYLEYLEVIIRCCILGALRQIILKLKMNFMLLFEISSLIKG